MDRLLKFPFLVFLLLATTGAKKRIDTILVTVNEDVILQSDIERFRAKAKSKNFQELLGVDPQMLGNTEAVIQLLIEEKIIDQQVKKLDIAASDQEVDGQIRAIVKRNGITQKLLADRLAQLGTSMGDYREGIRRQIERGNLIQREIKPTLEISDDQLKYFYQRAKKAEGAGDLQFRIAHILVSIAKGDAAAKKRAQKIADEAHADPEKFAALAKEYSDDSSTTELGGDLGFYAPNSLAKEFRSVVVRTPVGATTKPVRTAAGYHIIRVLETRAEDFTSLSAEKKEALRSQLRAFEVERKMAAWLDRKKNESHIKRFSENESDA